MQTIAEMIGQITPSSGVFGSKRVQIALLLAFVVLSAGCMGGGGGDGGPDTSDATNLVPADVNGVMYFSGDITDDQVTTELMDGIIEMSDEEMGPNDPGSWEEALEQAETESDLEISGFGSATVFFQENQGLSAENIGEDYAGIIVKSTWSWEDITQAAEEGSIDYEEDSYNGVTVYINSSGDSEDWAADLGDGTFVFGSENAVKDTIDVQEGDADAFGGELKTAYDNAGDGLMKAAIQIPESEQAATGGQGIPEIQQMTMVYSTSGSELTFNLGLATPSAEGAESLSGLYDFAKASFQQQEGPTANAIENIEVSTDDNVFNMEYTTTTDELLTLLEEADSGGTTGGGFGSQQTAVTG